MSRGVGWRAFAACAALVALPACGTTVTGAQSAGPAPDHVDGLGAAPAAGGSSQATGGDAAAAPVTGPDGTRTGPVVSAGEPQGTGGVPADAPVTGRGPSSGPGVTADAIYVGLVYSVNADALNQAAGVGGVTHGDEKGEYESVLRDINAHGGVAGRKLVPVWHELDGASPDSATAQEEATCADFTQDHHVFAVMGASSDSFQACIQKSGAVVIDSDLPRLDAAAFRRYPGLIELCCPSLDRIAAMQVTSLADQKYFTSWDSVQGAPGVAPPKVGVITYDDGSFRRPVDGILSPGLARLGYKPETVYIATPQSASEISGEAAAVQAAVLKFNSDGVTHVIIFEKSGELSLFFLREAENQHYRPRYGTNSGGYFQGLIGTVPSEQFAGATGFSYTPLGDLPPDRNPDNGPYSNSARRYCLALMKKDGFTFDSSNAEAIALSQCDQMYFLRDVAARMGSVLNAGTFVRAVDGLGSSFTAAIALGETFGPGRHDGVSAAYWWNYYADCDCMHYTGPLRRIP